MDMAFAFRPDGDKWVGLAVRPYLVASGRSESAKPSSH